MKNYGKDTLRQWIIDASGGDAIEAVVFGDMGWGDYNSETWAGYETMPKGKLLTWEQAQAGPWLDNEFDSGYGAPGCPACYVWTKTHVLYVVQYDGSTSMHAIPRYPVAGMPEMPGG